MRHILDFTSNQSSKRNSKINGWDRYRCAIWVSDVLKKTLLTFKQCWKTLGYLSKSCELFLWFLKYCTIKFLILYFWFDFYIVHNAFPAKMWRKSHVRGHVADKIRKYGAAESNKALSNPYVNVGVAGKYKMGSKPGWPQQLSHDDEDKLINHAIERAKLGIGFRKQNFLGFAGDLATKKKKPFKNKSPSDKWWRLIKERTNNEKISLRSPEGTTRLRHKGMSKAKVISFFTALQDTLQNTGIKDSSYTWNIDETGLQLVHHSGKILGRYM